MVGVITHFNDDKGFGFIRCGDEDVFFHISQWAERRLFPVRGREVEFDLAPSERRFDATEAHFVRYVSVPA